MLVTEMVIALGPTPLLLALAPVLPLDCWQNFLGLHFGFLEQPTVDLVNH